MAEPLTVACPDEISDRYSLLEHWAFRCLMAAAFGITFSIALGETMLGFCFLFLIIHLVRTRRPPVFPRIGVYVVVFVVIAVITAIFGIQPEKGVDRLSRLFWLLAIPAGVTLVTTPQRLTAMIKALSLGGGVLAAERCFIKPFEAWKAVQANVHGNDNVWTELIYEGSMTDGQMFMICIIATLAMLFYVREKGLRQRWWWTLLAFETLALIINYKRGSWICTLVIAGLFLVSRLGWKSLLPVVAIVLLSLLIPQVRMRITSLAEEFDPEGGGRLTMWTQVAPGLVRDHPFGVGYGSLTNEKMREYAPWVEEGRTHLHSNIPQVLVETGWLGLTVYVAWMFHVLAGGLRLLLRTRKQGGVSNIQACALLLMTLGILANGMVEYNFGDAEILIALALVMSLFATPLGRVLPVAFESQSGTMPEDMMKAC